MADLTKNEPVLITPSVIAMWRRAVAKAKRSKAAQDDGYQQGFGDALAELRSGRAQRAQAPLPKRGQWLVTNTSTGETWEREPSGRLVPLAFVRELPPRTKLKQFGPLWVESLTATDYRDGVAKTYDLVWVKRGVGFVLNHIYQQPVEKGEA